MGLEQVFSCPSTVEKLRSGALGNLVDGFCGWLLVKRHWGSDPSWSSV